MTSTRTQFVLSGLLLAALLFAGCHIFPAPQADPARFYTLNAGSPTPASSPSAGGTLRLGLRAVELPAYLQNRAMVVRAGPGGSEIRYEPNHRWAEPLDEGIERVVRARLLASAKVAVVFSAPFPVGEPRDFDVTVRVLRCEGERDASGKATAQFAAAIEIARADADHTVVARDSFITPFEWDGKNFAALANMLDVAVIVLGKQITVELPAQK